MACALLSRGHNRIIASAGIVWPCLRARPAAPVHRFGRSRIVSAPPAARTDHGLFKARTPARPEGASFGAVGEWITGGVVFCWGGCKLSDSGVLGTRRAQHGFVPASLLSLV